MRIRIEVDGPQGQVEITRHISLALADSGYEHLAAALRDAGNAILKSYGLPPSLSTSTPRERLIEESKRPTPRGGW